MARILTLEYQAAGPEMRREYDAQIAAHGRVTNMKRTLGHSPAAFRALMEWYALESEVLPFLGKRRTHLFAHAISSQADCLICSTFFRRLLAEGGEDPDHLALDEREADLVCYGRSLARDPHGVTDELHARLGAWLSTPQLVALTAFGAMMIATNVFNNALRVDLDEYLIPYRGEKG